MLLSAKDLTIRFGGVVALNRVSFEVDSDSITALIGPNGAGKTTAFNCITGFYRANSGQLTLKRAGHPELDLLRILGEDFQPGDFFDPRAFSMRLYYKMFGGAHRVSRAGIARTFQNIRLFKEMTAMENLLVAQRHRVNHNLLSGFLQTTAFRNAEQEAIEQAVKWLEFFEILPDANRLAGELPYGDQRRLEIARALCTDPILICLDEPAAGLNPRETEGLNAHIRQLRDQFNLTVFLIEHDMGLVMDISDKVVVLDHGEVIASGTPQQIQNDEAVLRAYLGVADGEEIDR
ncbi:MAG: ATP-binding cassette domain-containing protein [Magnetococcales bacterium]|nr:ATP-binding cassette domain-containing protein [Magnetococcales bacterium]